VNAHEPRFLPEEWDAVYEANGRTAESFAFCRSADLVVQACAELLPKDILVVDAGCGSGRVSSRLSDLGVRVLAMDRDPAMVRFARRRIASASDARGVSFAAGDVSALPVADAACEAVVAVSLIGCVADLRGFLAEVHRVLRPGGLAILTVTNRTSLLLRANEMLNRWTERMGKRRDECAYYLHRHDDVVRVLGEIGFTVDRARFYNSFVARGRRMFPPRRVATAIERFARGPLAEHLAANFLLVARRRAHGAQPQGALPT